MPFRTLAEALDFTQDELLTGLAAGVFTTNQTTAFLDVVLTDRAVIKGNREVSVGTAQVAGCDTTLTSSAIETAPYSYPLESFIRQFDVCRTVSGLASSFADQLAIDANGAAKAIGRTIENQLITGSGVAGTAIAGLINQTAAGQIINTVGTGVLALEDLDALWDLVTVRSAKMAYVCNAATRRKIATLLRAAGGTNPVDLAGTGFVVPTVNGIPVLTNDWCVDDDIHLVNMSAADQGLALFLGANGADEAAQVSNLIRIERVGTRHDKDRVIYRLSADVAAVVQSQLAIGLLRIV